MLEGTLLSFFQWTKSFNHDIFFHISAVLDSIPSYSREARSSSELDWKGFPQYHPSNMEALLWPTARGGGVTFPITLFWQQPGVWVITCQETMAGGEFGPPIGFHVCRRGRIKHTFPELLFDFVFSDTVCIEPLGIQNCTYLVLHL